MLSIFLMGISTKILLQLSRYVLGSSYKTMICQSQNPKLNTKINNGTVTAKVKILSWQVVQGWWHWVPGTEGDWNSCARIMLGRNWTLCRETLYRLLTQGIIVFLQCLKVTLVEFSIMDKMVVLFVLCLSRTQISSILGDVVHHFRNCMSHFHQLSDSDISYLPSVVTLSLTDSLLTTRSQHGVWGKRSWWAAPKK